MMPAGGGGGGGGGAAAAPAEAAVEEVVEKTHFTIKLDSFDSASKIKLIKEVRARRRAAHSAASASARGGKCSAVAGLPLKAKRHPPLCRWQVRAITGLGLKEAKEAVEKAPTELKSKRHALPLPLRCLRACANLRIHTARVVARRAQFGVGAHGSVGAGAMGRAHDREHTLAFGTLVMAEGRAELRRVPPS
eukprot:1019499-Prymnesium_polylepis.1